jgi:hypothetical protein
MNCLINPKDVAYKSDLKYELRSTENCIVFSQFCHIFGYKYRTAVQNYFFMFVDPCIIVQFSQ